MTQQAQNVQLSLQFTASLCHWIVYEEVLALDLTIINGWHCETIVFGVAHFWVEMLR
jgi:hypothetical protein